MISQSYQSQSYPTLSQLIEISSKDFLKLRSLMLERGELSKFIKWQKAKYFKIIGQAYIPFTDKFNS